MRPHRRGGTAEIDPSDPRPGIFGSILSIPTLAVDRALVYKFDWSRTHKATDGSNGLDDKVRGMLQST